MRLVFPLFQGSLYVPTIPLKHIVNLKTKTEVNSKDLKIFLQNFTRS